MKCDLFYSLFNLLVTLSLYNIYVKYFIFHSMKWEILTHFYLEIYLHISILFPNRPLNFEQVGYNFTSLIRFRFSNNGEKRRAIHIPSSKQSTESRFFPTYGIGNSKKWRIFVHIQSDKFPLGKRVYIEWGFNVHFYWKWVF